MKDKYYESRFPRFVESSGSIEDESRGHDLEESEIVSEHNKAIDMIIALGNALEIADDAAFRRIWFNETTESGK